MARRVFYTQTPLSFNHSGKKDPTFPSLRPFSLKRKNAWNLAFYDKDSDPSKFDEKDLQLLSMMANQMSCAVENALIHYATSTMALEHEKRVKELSTCGSSTRPF